MYANVYEQTKEIGVLRAIGLRKGKITAVYMYEAFVLIIGSAATGRVSCTVLHSLLSNTLLERYNHRSCRGGCFHLPANSVHATSSPVCFPHNNRHRCFCYGYSVVPFVCPWSDQKPHEEERCSDHATQRLIAYSGPARICCLRGSAGSR